MTQNFTAIDASVPGGDTGSSQAEKLNDWRSALLTLNGGTVRPSYVQAGTLWRDTTGSPWLIKFYDGAQDITMFEVNPSTHLVTKIAFTAATPSQVLAGILAGIPIDPVGLQSRMSTVSQYRSRSEGVILTAKIVADALAEVVITDAATIVLDMTTFINGRVTLGGNRTIGLPTGGQVGWGGSIAFVQGAGGNKVPTFEVGWQFGGKIAPTFSTAAGAVDILEFRQLTSGGDYYGALNNDVGRPA